MRSLEKQLYTLEEYLVLDHESEEKIEFWNGHVWTVEKSFATLSKIKSNLIFEVGKARRYNKSVRVFSSVRVKVPAYPPYRYPDLSALCGTAEFEKLGKQDLFINPQLIVEVSSDSTVDFDYSYKFTYYKSIPSFSEYILIAQDRPHVAQFIKQADNAWLNHEFNAVEDSFRLASLDCEMSLSEIYQDVAFPERIPPFRINE